MVTSTATPTSRQFTVRGLLLLTALVAVCLLPVVQWGVLGVFPAVLLGTVGISLFHKRYILAGGLFGLSVRAPDCCCRRLFSPRLHRIARPAKTT